MSNPSAEIGVQGSVPTSASRRWKWSIYLVVAVLVVLAVRYLPVQAWLKDTLDRVAGLGFIGIVLFIALYVVATVLFIPGAVLTLGAGAIYGVLWGSVYVSIASTIGATCAFLIGRHLARETITRKIGGNKAFAAIDKAVATGGWKIVGLTRLSPLFPFTFLNYAFGLTRISLREYVVASWIGMMPGTVLYVYLGSLAQAASGQRARTVWQWALYGIGLVATVAVTVIITRMARRELQRSINI